jgi:hypothetical protein
MSHSAAIPTLSTGHLSKRNDAKAGKDLYSTANCPNCGAPFDTKMGGVRPTVRAGGTLTNIRLLRLGAQRGRAG